MLVGTELERVWQVTRDERILTRQGSPDVGFHQIEDPKTEMRIEVFLLLSETLEEEGPERGHLRCSKVLQLVAVVLQAASCLWRIAVQCMSRFSLLRVCSLH